MIVDFPNFSGFKIPNGICFYYRNDFCLSTSDYFRLTSLTVWHLALRWNPICTNPSSCLVECHSCFSPSFYDIFFTSSFIRFFVAFLMHIEKQSFMLCFSYFWLKAAEKPFLEEENEATLLKFAKKSCAHYSKSPNLVQKISFDKYENMEITNF